MIRIILLGRTGNLLFQYALGRVIASNHGVPLVLDASWFNSEGWAEVSHFLKLPLKAKVVRPLSLGSRALRNLTGKHYWQFINSPFLKESNVDQSYDPRFANAPADCVLFGYFQTPLYFQSMGHELRTEIKHLLSQFKDTTLSADGINLQLCDPRSVAVHVRRGDYLNHPAFQVCDIGYYVAAMNKMRDLVRESRFFVFSDDPEWCVRHFKADDTLVVERRFSNSNPMPDLYRMSIASHHVISNSTYSWWAAWLGGHSRQNVIMPDRWYQGEIKAPIAEKKLEHWQILDTKNES